MARQIDGSCKDVLVIKEQSYLVRNAARKGLSNLFRVKGEESVHIRGCLPKPACDRKIRDRSLPWSGQEPWVDLEVSLRRDFDLDLGDGSGPGEDKRGDIAQGVIYDALRIGVYAENDWGGIGA